MSLAGRCALVTGSTQGLGLATARRLASAGCHVILNGFGDADLVSALIRELDGSRRTGRP